MIDSRILTRVPPVAKHPIALSARSRQPMAAYSQDPKIGINCPTCGASLRYAATTSLSERPSQSIRLCPTGTKVQDFTGSRAACAPSWQMGQDVSARSIAPWYPSRRPA
jgi:hypothetical protein